MSAAGSYWFTAVMLVAADCARLSGTEAQTQLAGRRQRTFRWSTEVKAELTNQGCVGAKRGWSWVNPRPPSGTGGNMLPTRYKGIRNMSSVLGA